jgi:plastocyanin
MNGKCVAVLATVATVGAGAPAVAQGGGHATSSHTVLLRSHTFAPSTVAIHRGESVTWVWENHGVLHNVIGHSFASPTQKRGSFTVRFTHGGTYSYKCTIHPHMDGTVIVH